jgi:aldoxime dehydratase
MESAIDKHLKCPRTLSRRVPDEYQPPFPMWVGRADEQLEQVVMGYLGVQYRGEDQRAAALHAMRHIAASLPGLGRPVPDRGRVARSARRRRRQCRWRRQ